MRTRTKSAEWRWACTDRRPLCPASAATRLHPDRAGREVELVVDDHDGAGSSIPKRRSQRADGTAPNRSCTWWARPAPPGAPPSVTSATRACMPFSARSDRAVALPPAARRRRRRRCGGSRRIPRRGCRARPRAGRPPCPPVLGPGRRGGAGPSSLRCPPRPTRRPADLGAGGRPRRPLRPSASAASPRR